MINTAEEFVRLRTSDDPEEYLRAASEHAELAVWLDIIDRFPEMRAWVAHNKTVPIEILRILARDADPAVRTVVAMKNKLPEDLFSLFASDADDGVRQRISYNKHTPQRVLEKLARDTNELVSEPARARLTKVAERGCEVPWKNSNSPNRH
jgi:hypothetical protein